MRHHRTLRYRVLWCNLAGVAYAADRRDFMAALREALSLHKSSIPWQRIRIHDGKLGVIWELRTAPSEPE